MADENIPGSGASAPPKRRPGAPKGNRNAFKHGRYTAAECAQRRRYTALKRRANALIEEVEVLIRARRLAAQEAAEIGANASQVLMETQGEGGTPNLWNNYLSPSASPPLGEICPKAPA